jgi:hypothetical protein
MLAGVIIWLAMWTNSAWGGGKLNVSSLLEYQDNIRAAELEAGNLVTLGNAVTGPHAQFHRRDFRHNLPKALAHRH